MTQKNRLEDALFNEKPDYKSIYMIADGYKEIAPGESFYAALKNKVVLLPGKHQIKSNIEFCYNTIILAGVELSSADKKKSLTINSKLSFEVRGENKNRVIFDNLRASYIYGGAKCNFKYANFQNMAIREKNGAAIEIGGFDHVHFENCNFLWNISNHGGGAISLVRGGTVTLRNCLFEHNSSYCGGAILSQDASILSNDCTFRNNFAEWGQDIYIQYGTKKFKEQLLRNNSFDDSINSVYVAQPPV